MLTAHNPSVAAPTTLDQLHAYLRDGMLWDGAPLKHGEIDLTSLPTFGGPEPLITWGVWSYDATRLLVGPCAADLEIIDRQ